MNDTNKINYLPIILGIWFLIATFLQVTFHFDSVVLNLNPDVLIVGQVISNILYFSSTLVIIFYVLKQVFTSMTSMNKRIAVTYIAMFVFAVSVQVGLFTADIVDRQDSFHLMRLSSITNIIYYGTIFFVFVYLFKEYFKAQMNHFKLNSKVFGLAILIGFGLLFVGAIIANIVIVAATGEAGNSANQQALDQLLNGTWFDKTSLVLFAIFFAPVVEEMVFRKAAFDFLQKYKFSPLMIIFLSSSIFGLIHVTSGDFVQVIYYFTLGALLGTLYHFSKRNILIPIGAHLLLNLYVTITMFL